MVLQFDQEKFEQLLSEGGSSPINMHKHRKISVSKSPLIVARKQVPDETKKPVCWPNSVSTETELASDQYPHAVREAKSASKALWIEKSNSAMCKADGSLISASTKSNKVSNCKTTSALHRAQLRFSREAKGKAAVTLLPAAKAFVREAKSEAHFGAHSEATSLKERYFTVLIKHQVLR